MGRHLLVSILIAAGLTVLGVVGLATTTDADSHPAAATAAAFQPAAADRAALATLATMQDPATGLWPIAGISAWWSSANDVTALIDAERALDIHQYDGLIARTYALDRDYTGPQFRNNGPDFKNNYFDDTAWWGLAWLDAYRWTGDRAYLQTAEDDNAYAHSARTSACSTSTTCSPCSGAIPWAVPAIRNGDQANAITNELGLQLSARLATVTGRPMYRTEALQDWAWLQRSGLIGRDGLVRDHLDASCRPTGPAWSYTQGSLAGGLAALAAATGDDSYLAAARRVADAATTSSALNAGGVLTDPCEQTGSCSVDGATFKGAAVRGLGVLNRALPDHPYTAYLLRQATTMHWADRMAGDTYGQHWAGAPDLANPARQGSAVDLLTATMGGA
jgi:predicted alpha-1,6-mannanase (GH76 family)